MVRSRAKGILCVSMILAVLLLFAAVPPVVAENNSEGEDLKLTCKAAMLIDSGSGQILYEKNADKLLTPASLTKMLTCIIVLEELDPDDKVTIPKEATGLGGQSMNLKTGEVLTVDQLTKVMMVYSANDAAAALAIETAGSIDAFSEMMNEKAQELGCDDSNFINPNGLTDSLKHITTADDMARIARAGMQNESFRKIVKMKKVTVPATNKSKKREYKTTNLLLSSKKYKYEGTIGIKTGTMPVAGYCQVTAAKRDGTELICVVMNDPDEKTRVKDSTTLLDYGFENYYSEELIEKGGYTGKVRVKYGHKTHVKTNVKNGAYATLPKEMDGAMAKSVTDIKKNIKAPIKKGTKVGEVTVYVDGDKVSESDIVISESVKTGGPWTSLYISDITFILAAGTVVLLIVIYVSLKIRRRSARRKDEMRRDMAREKREKELEAERMEKRRRGWPF